MQWEINSLFYQTTHSTKCFSKDALDYECPGVIDAPQYYGKVHFEPKLIQLSGESGHAKMRFRIFYDKTMDKMPPVFKSVTQEVADFWSNVLSVTPYGGTIFIERNCVLPEPLFTLSNVTKKQEQRCLGQCATITTCVDTVVPEDHLKECTYCLKNGTECQTTGQRGKGIQNADMVFYVSANQTHCIGRTIAYAGACNTDPYLDRPIVGGINFCPLMALSRLKQKKQLVSTLKHEMMHAFGFAPSLYNLFRDSDGEPLVERDEVGRPKLSWMKQEFGPKVRKTIERQWHVRGGIVSSNRTFIVTPNVVREARAHFNCSELEGAELEDSGDSGAAGAHWESRVYYHEIMKANAFPGELRMSRIDLALLEDTGWYKVNYSLAEPMEYGKDLGCDFCMKSCKYWMDKKRSEGKSIEPFCDQTAERSLNYLCNQTDKIHFGCPLVRNDDPVPKEHQYFDKLEGVNDENLHFYSGNDIITDFCPIPYAGDISSCNTELTREESLTHITKYLSNVPLEGFGIDSYCFESNTNWTINQYKDTCSKVKTLGRGQNVGCYKYSCMSGLLVIQVSNKRFPCFFDGQVLEVSLFGLTSNSTHEGTIICPSCEQMCGQSTDFKCMPENQIWASKYPYPRDECIDGDYIKKLIKSWDEEGNTSSTVINDTNDAETMESDTWTTTETLTPISKASVILENKMFHQRSEAWKLGPSHLLRILLIYLVIVNY